MTDERWARVEQAYRLFNLRDVDALLPLLTEDVSWPDVANARVQVGRPAVRAYWLGQFAVANPQVTPLELVPVGEDLVARVEQRVFDLHGTLLLPAVEVFHRFAFAGTQIAQMRIFAERAEALA